MKATDYVIAIENLSPLVAQHTAAMEAPWGRFYNLEETITSLMELMR